MWSGVDRFLSFFAFRLKDSVFLSLEKQCFVLTILPEAIAIKSQEIVKNRVFFFSWHLQLMKIDDDWNTNQAIQSISSDGN